MITVAIRSVRTSLKPNDGLKIQTYTIRVYKNSNNMVPPNPTASDLGSRYLICSPVSGYRAPKLRLFYNFDLLAASTKVTWITLSELSTIDCLNVRCYDGCNFCVEHHFFDIDNAYGQYGNQLFYL